MRGRLFSTLPFVISERMIFGGKTKFIWTEFESKGLGTFIQQISDAITKYKDHELERKLRMENRMKNLEIDIHSRDTNQDANADESGRSEAPSSPEESEDGSAQTK